MSNQPQSATIAVIVTHNRVETLKKSLQILSQQTYPLQSIIVVDNANQSEVKTLCTQDFGTPIKYLGSETNLGGAGGFALGILFALSQGAEYIWLADDDGRPENETVLTKLFSCLHKYQLEEVSPVVSDINNPQLLAFPLRSGLTWKRKRSELTDSSHPADFLPRIASLFNGALFSRSAIEKIGVPDIRLFIRGDEVDIHQRMTRAQIKFGTCLTTSYLHPQGADEFISLLPGKIHAQYPDNPVKRYYTYRNRGYLLAKPGMKKLQLQEWVRFFWLFILKKRSISDFNNWRKLYRQGRREQFNRYHQLESGD